MTIAIDDGLWSAIGDPTRRRMLDLLLASGTGTATSLSEQLPVTRQAVAKHLGVSTAPAWCGRHPRGARSGTASTRLSSNAPWHSSTPSATPGTPGSERIKQISEAINKSK
jgi:hypothetical protein